MLPHQRLSSSRWVCWHRRVLAAAVFLWVWLHKSQLSNERGPARERGGYLVFAWVIGAFIFGCLQDADSGVSFGWADESRPGR
jgi:hypothetical protein